MNMTGLFAVPNKAGKQSLPAFPAFPPAQPKSDLPAFPAFPPAQERQKKEITTVSHVLFLHQKNQAVHF
jgi:hypothetical protein